MEVPDETKTYVLKLADLIRTRGRPFGPDEKVYANGDPRRHVVCLDDRRIDFEDGFIDLRSYIMSWESGLLRYELVGKEWSATFSSNSANPDGIDRHYGNFSDANWVIFSGDVEQMYRTFVLLKMFDRL